MRIIQQRRRLSKEQLISLLRCFCSDIEVSKASKIALLNRNTVNKYYQLFREIIYTQMKRDYYLTNTICEIDESYFGPRRYRGNNGKLQGQKKIIVFGIIERNGKVYTEIVPSIKTRTLHKTIRKHISVSTTIYSDECSSYNYLQIKRYHHETVTHSHREFVRGQVNTNLIESFWSYCKRRLNKFNGIDQKHFPLHLRECEFRFNNRGNDLELIVYDLVSKNHYSSSLLYNDK